MSRVADVLGLDIGGANLKAAHTNGAARLVPFALWKNPAGLSQALQELLHSMPDADTLAVTMTGELCDCYETKRQGVNCILDAVEAVAGQRRIRVWGSNGPFACNGGKLMSLGEARTFPLRIAAANWLALATFVGRFVGKGSGLLIDIGSTTTDIVPLWKGQPIPRGLTDSERLCQRELIYLGVRRTPLSAVVGMRAIHGWRFAAELFATTLDVMLLTGLVPEDSSDLETADGRPATQAAALGRLACMTCADPEMYRLEYHMRRLAVALLRYLITHLANAVKKLTQRLPDHTPKFVLAGSGEFLARKVLAQPNLVVDGVVSLTHRLGPRISEAACANAVAMLAAERPDGQ